MRVLGIETSCDETGVAVYDGERGLLAHALYSQAHIHAEYGGVVPEIASRDHVRKLIPLLDECLAESGSSRADIDAVAYTAGPGLIGALLVGAALGRAIALALDVPAIAVHHMEGHLLAPLLEDDPPGFPFVALLVSGGHSMLVEVADIGRYRVLGETLDDAAGEAFDKTAKLLGLGYPVGPALERAARARLQAFLGDVPDDPVQYAGQLTHLAEAIDQELVSSAHGVFRGGLAVHLAMVAMGGNLGMQVDLARVPASEVHRNSAMLFSESAGRFIVTVDPANRNHFEKLFEPSTCACIGTVSATPELIIKGVNNKPITSLSVSDLKTAWKKPFGDLI